MLSWKVGRVTVTRIVEMDLPVPFALALPQATREDLRELEWLYPHFVGEDDTLKLSVHALLVEAPGLRLIVDTCVGNDRPREITGGQPLTTPFLEYLGEVGWSRDAVDAVICTHLHVDHVGWNTMLEHGKWVPTFPRAQYFIGRLEYAYWKEYDDEEQQAMLGDSIRPIFDAGLVRLVELDRRHLARDPAHAFHRTHAGPRQRDDRIRWRAGRDHRRHDPPSVPDGAPRVVVRKQGAGSSRSHSLASLLRMGRPWDARHRQSLRRPHGRTHRSRRRSFQI